MVLQMLKYFHKETYLFKENYIGVKERKRHLPDLFKRKWIRFLDNTERDIINLNVIAKSFIWVKLTGIPLYIQ